MTLVAKDGNGTNQNIATDVISSTHYQEFKIFDGTAGSTNAAVVTAGGLLKVDASGANVTVGTAPAAARTTDSISAALATDAIMNGTTALAPSFGPITASASGVTTVVSAITSKKIRVLGLVVVATSAVTVKFQSHTTTATATGTMPLGANGVLAIPFSPTGWFETVAGEALDINLGGAVAVGGTLIYVAV